MRAPPRYTPRAWPVLHLVAAALLTPGGGRAVRAELCGGDFGMVPVAAGQSLHDGGPTLIIVDTSSRLAAGTVASFTLHNWGAAAPITMQIWRPAGGKRLRLVCETAATLKAGMQTIPAAAGCTSEEGDVLGWWQLAGGAVGSISADQIVAEADASVCRSVGSGVVWNDYHTGAAVPVGGTFDVFGCGQRNYAVSVHVSGECLACAWGCHALAIAALLAALYLGVGVAVRRGRGSPAGRGGESLMEMLPHQKQWRALWALVVDGVVFVRAAGAGRGGARVGALRTPLTAAVGESGRGAEGRAKKSSVSSSKTSKHATTPKKSKQSKSSKAAAASGVAGHSDAVQDEREGPGWSGNAAELAEQRDAAAHSSQQKIKVVLKS